MHRIRSPNILAVVVNQGETGGWVQHLDSEVLQEGEVLEVDAELLEGRPILSSKPSSVRFTAWSAESQQLSYNHLGMGVTRITFSLSSRRSSGSITQNSLCCLSLEATPRSPST
jgi:hypothetical protein